MAVLTITTNAQQAARAVVAFGAKLNLGRNATAEEIKEDLIQYMRAVVRDQERIANAEANPPAAFDPA